MHGAASVQSRGGDVARHESGAPCLLGVPDQHLSRAKRPQIHRMRRANVVWAWRVHYAKLAYHSQDVRAVPGRAVSRDFQDRAPRNSVPNADGVQPWRVHQPVQPYPSSNVFDVSAWSVPNRQQAPRRSVRRASALRSRFKVFRSSIFKRLLCQANRAWRLHQMP